MLPRKPEGPTLHWYLSTFSKRFHNFFLFVLFPFSFPFLSFVLFCLFSSSDRNLFCLFVCLFVCLFQASDKKGESEDEKAPKRDNQKLGLIEGLLDQADWNHADLLLSRLSCIDPGSHPPVSSTIFRFPSLFSFLSLFSLLSSLLSLLSSLLSSSLLSSPLPNDIVISALSLPSP
jgi:hypothetical protein